MCQLQESVEAPEEHELCCICLQALGKRFLRTTHVSRNGASQEHWLHHLCAEQWLKCVRRCPLCQCRWRTLPWTEHEELQLIDSVERILYCSQSQSSVSSCSSVSSHSASASACSTNSVVTVAAQSHLSSPVCAEKHAIGPRKRARRVTSNSPRQRNDLEQGKTETALVALSCSSGTSGEFPLTDRAQATREEGSVDAVGGVSAVVFVGSALPHSCALLQPLHHPAIVAQRKAAEKAQATITRQLAVNVVNVRQSRKMNVEREPSQELLQAIRGKRSLTGHRSIVRR
jgi:hypothetical protein